MNKERAKQRIEEFLGFVDTNHFLLCAPPFSLTLSSGAGLPQVQDALPLPLPAQDLIIIVYR